MGTTNDPVVLIFSSHTHCADGTSRNDVFSYTTTLANYKTDLVSYSTPLYNQVASERTNTGTLIGTFTGEPYKGGTPAGGPCDLRLEVGIGLEVQATPTRYHLVRQDILSNSNITSPTDIYNWTTQLLTYLLPVNIYPGGVNFF